MPQTRREFFRDLLLASAAAATLDIEKLLWVPKPIITVPTLPSRIGSQDFIMLLKQIYGRDYLAAKMNKENLFFKSLKDAVAAAEPNDTILVGAWGFNDAPTKKIVIS